MTDKLIEKLNGYGIKGLAATVVAILIFAFGAGAASSGYIGLPERVTSVETDISAIVCILSSIEEQRDATVCYLLMSEQTRQFVERARQGRLSQ